MSYHLNERMRKNTVETNRSISNHFEIFHGFFGLAKKNGLRLFRVCFEYIESVLRIFIFWVMFEPPVFSEVFSRFYTKFLSKWSPKIHREEKLYPNPSQKWKKNSITLPLPGANGRGEMLRGIKFDMFLQFSHSPPNLKATLWKPRRG